MQPYHIPPTALLLALGILATGATAARGQQPGRTYTVDAASSLAWWQVEPNLQHLWATTCPADPSWLPGEGRSPGPGMDQRQLQPSQDDTVHIPLFVRIRARPVCAEAVHGQLIAPDSLGWGGAHGRISVLAAALVTGQKERDAFAASHVLEVTKYPDITFLIDSVVGVTYRGDTLSATAVGILELHGTDTPLAIPVVAWPEAGGLRVRGRWFMTGDQLWKDYDISKEAMALGVGMGIWRRLWLGVDLLLRAAPAAS